MRKVKALVLLSGGLDSILAAELLKRQGIEVTALSFKSYFFSDNAARKAAKKLNLPLKVIDFSEEHLQLVKNPSHGYGKTMNPCIDCHALMLKKAKKTMKREGFDFVATGEVLGERPMSQNLNALRMVEKDSSLSGYLLRPLSAKLLEPTIPEEQGLVKRNRLLDISGRSRRKQMALAEKWGIKEYPTPAGGCLLTDPGFSKRLKELFDKYSDCQGNDVELLKFGRHFWPFGKLRVKIVVGRNEKENKQIKKLAQKRDILIEMKNYPGPTTLVRGYSKEGLSLSAIEKAKELTQEYSTKAKGLTKQKINITIKQIYKKEG